MAQANRWRDGSEASVNPELASVVRRNVRALLEMRQRAEREQSVEDRIAAAITRFTGSLWFVYLHLLLLAGWLAANLQLISGIRPWDPYPFVMLAMIASVEAIFLSTFVLISQNRMAALDARRAELDLQINLLAEHEITRLMELSDAIARHLGVEVGRDSELDELKRDVPPETILREIENVEEELDRSSVAE